jgi:hypothetical protein
MVKEQLNAARELVNSLSNSSIKTSLINRLNAIQDEISQATETRMDIDEIEESYLVYGDGTDTQQNIRVLVEIFEKSLYHITNLQDCYGKAELSYRLTLINDIINSSIQAFNSLITVKQEVANLKTKETRKTSLKYNVNEPLK